MNIWLSRLLGGARLRHGEFVHDWQPVLDWNDKCEIKITRDNKEMVCDPAVILNAEPIPNPSSLCS